MTGGGVTEVTIDEVPYPIRVAQRCQQQVAILERALRFYANPENWGEDDWGVASVMTKAYGDPGKKARNALKRAGR